MKLKSMIRLAVQVRCSINIGKSVSKRMPNSDNIKYYAQELKENTYNLTRMNLVMRGINPSNITTKMR